MTVQILVSQEGTELGIFVTVLNQRVFANVKPCPGVMTLHVLCILSFFLLNPAIKHLTYAKH